MPARNNWIRVALATVTVFAAGAGSARSQGLSEGVSPQGATGGLVIPSARVLPDHGMALGFSNYTEPAFRAKTYRRNMSFGTGILGHIELFGRFIDYNNSPAGEYLNSGPRDLSANLKVRIPLLPEHWPQAAFGWTDIAGGNVLFKSTYGVVTHRWRSLSGSVGYVHHEASQYEASFHGPFGGLEWRLPPTGLSLLAEYDGQTAHAGGRWLSPPLEKAGDVQLGATVQRAFGAALPEEDAADRFSFALNLHWPVGNLDKNRGSFRPLPAAPSQDVSAQEAPAAPPAVSDTKQLLSLRRKLVAAGLERVHVGLREGSVQDSSGAEWIVEYENHRYAHNEVDAIGVVLGWGSTLAPSSVRTLRVVTLKDGLALYETTVPVAAYRAFLDQGSPRQARDSLTWRSGSSGASASAQWEREAPSQATRLRFEIRPGLNYALGTEVGAFDYSLAAKPRLVVPLWTGARVTTGYSLPLSHSVNTEDGRAFLDLRYRTGLETMSLSQSFWVGPRILFVIAAGRYHFDVWGGQSEIEAFVPGTSDVIRLRGAVYRPAPEGLEGRDELGAVSYRHAWSPVDWTEIGWQRFGDGTAGPTFEWTRWSSDVGLTLFAKQGGPNRFTGLRLTFPLTPRRGMQPRLATVAGPSQYSLSLRSMLQEGPNFVAPTSARDLALETDLEDEFLNSGRISQDYLKSQFYRMREAFYKDAGPVIKGDSTR